MITKTYGVMGLLEWQCVLPFGRSKLTITFSGGALTAYGTTPALFVTSDRVVQSIIERSQYFKQGRIRLVATKQQGEAKAAAAPAKEAGLRLVEVSCIEDAADYLQQEFGLRNLRRKSDIVQAAARHGVKFNI